MPSRILLLLPLSLLASMAMAATANDVVKDFASIKSQTLKIRNETLQLTGGIEQAELAIQIDTDANALDATIQNTTAAANSLPKLGTSDSAKIALAVNGIQTPVFSTLDALVSKRDVFDQIVDGSEGIVYADLTKLQADTRKLGGAVSGKLSVRLAKLAPLLVDNIDFHFQRAVDAFTPAPSS